MFAGWTHSRSARHSGKSHVAGDGERRAGDTLFGSRNIASPEHRARKLRESLQHMGPQFSCFALYLSSRIDLLPAEYCRELALTPHSSPPLPPSAVQKLLLQELGDSLDRSFDAIDYAPLESTLITQSHGARLRTGEPVTVTLLRPEYHALQNRNDPARFLDRNSLKRVCGELATEDAIADFAYALQRKANLSVIRKALESTADDQPCELLLPRKVYRELSTAGLLTLEHMEVQNVNQVLAGRPYGAGALLRRVCMAWLELALRRPHFPVDPRPYNVYVSTNDQVAFEGCEFAALPKSARENLWNYLLAAMVDDPDRSSMYLLREMQVPRNPALDPQNFRSSFRQSAYFAALEPVLGTDSNALPQLVFQHWKTALEHGYLTKPHLLCFYRGLFSVARIARELSTPGDHLRDAMDDLRAARVFDQIRDLADWRRLLQNADKFADAMVHFPKTFDDALTWASRPPQDVFTHKEFDAPRPRNRISANTIAILLLIVAMFFSPMAHKNGFVEKLVILALMLAGLVVLRSLEDPDRT